MSVADLVRLALERLSRSRLRSALTTLGVVIGVASVVALVAAGQGAGRDVTQRIEGIGTNLLTVNPGRSGGGPVRGAAGTSGTLTVADATALDELDGVAAVAPEITTQRTVLAEGGNTTTTIVGTTAGYGDVRNFDVRHGSALTDLAVDERLRVAVVGSQVALDLDLDRADLGSELIIGGIPFRLIGILQPKGAASFQNPDDQILVPIGTLQRQFVGGDVVRTIGVSVVATDRIAEVAASIVRLLRDRHGIAPGATDDFTILDQAQLLSAASAVGATLTLLLAGLGSISLVVGGVGIMNIMLVSVRERTREIGIRKALGARRRDILAQFLVEALTLSSLGGLLGVAVGLGVSVLVGQLAGWGFEPSIETVVVAVAVSAAVGVVFGVWPAREAAVLDPIVALRFE